MQKSQEELETERKVAEEEAIAAARQEGEQLEAAIQFVNEEVGNLKMNILQKITSFYNEFEK